MKKLKTFVSGILAGVSIAIGAAAYLSLESRALGAVFFTVGLFTVCTLELALFTGKVCYAFERGKAYAADLIFIWLGNLFGTTAAAALLRLTRISPELTARAETLCSAKLSDSPLSIFILAVFCNILIYIAVEGYNRGKHEIGKYLALILGVSVFVICGFEHCVANMFYFSLANAWGAKAACYIIIMTVGNAVGGVLLPLVRKFITVEKT